MNLYELQPRFAALFDGLKIAHGTGKGQWIKRPLRPEDWIRHLQGNGPGIGVAPLREDSTVAFAAIDLDEPDFEAAREMQRYIPGTSWIERSRSGNAHVWVFFESACPAWLPMGVLREATLAAGKKGVEIFPKNHDFGRVRLGNYINLPYHGDERPMLCTCPTTRGCEPETTQGCFMPLPEFLDEAANALNDPKDWERRASLMQIGPPSERKNTTTFGAQTNLHKCAERIIAGDAGLIPDGHRQGVLFMLSKCLTNWKEVDHDEALSILESVNEDLCDGAATRSEVRRILGNAERGMYTSTGCDDPLVQPFSDPTCPIANPRSR